jgi:hypothetical protein
MGAYIVRYKFWLIGLLLTLAIVLIWFQHQSKAWERDLTVVFIDIEYVTQLNGVEDTQYVYEITNNTNHALSDVKMVFKCFSYSAKPWLYEASYSDYLPQGATKEFRISKNAILKFNEENNKSRNYYKHELVKVKYKK